MSQDAEKLSRQILLLERYCDLGGYQQMTIILETKRLILRTWLDSDLEAMSKINEDTKVCEFLPGPFDKKQTQTMIESWMLHYQQKGYGIYAVELKSTHEMIGFLGLWTPTFEAHFTPAVEIAWRLASKHWNQGYATEGAQAVLDYAFNQVGLNEIVSFTVVNNLPSQRVMQKIGLKHNPLDDFDHPNIDKESPLRRHVLYSLKRTDYIKMKEG